MTGDCADEHKTTLEKVRAEIYVGVMASITLKAVPRELHAQLKKEATANFRSLDQEAIARIQRSFELEQRFSTPVVERLIGEAIASGPEEPLMREKFDDARRRARSIFQRRRKAA
jgi:hypothetical protein